MRTRRLAALALLVAFSLVTGAAAAPPKDAMVVGLLAEPVTMDPPQITDLNSARITKRIFEGLVAQELGSYKLVPGLAQSWDICKDGLTYTFKLRPNVKFHDGTAFNAEAVKFCFERQLNDKSPFYATGTYPYVKSFLGNIAGVEVVDPLTLQIKLKAQLAPFLQYLAHQSLFVYSPEALKKWGKDMVKHPVGTGPFKLDDLGARREGGAGTQRRLLGRRAEGPAGHLRADHRGPGAAGRHQDRRDRPDDGRPARQSRRSPQGSQRRRGREQLLGRLVHRAEHAPSRSSRTSACARP